MQIKDAAVRTLRTVAQVLVGIPLLVTPVVALLPDGFKVAGVDVHKVSTAGVAIVSAVAVGILAFAQNLAEDNTALQFLPK